MFSINQSLHQEELNLHTSEIQKEILWIETLVAHQCIPLLEGNNDDVQKLGALNNELNEACHYFQFLLAHEVNTAHRILLSLLISFELSPNVRTLVCQVISEHQEKVGGHIDAQGKFKIDVRFWLFIISGLSQHFISSVSLFDPFHFLFAQEIVESGVNPQEINLNTPIQLSNAYFKYFLGGSKPRFDHGESFPADLMQSKIALENIVLKSSTQKNLLNLIHFIKITYGQKSSAIVDEVRSRLPKYYVVPFTGVPGTGKSVTAAALGHKFGMDTYRVNLSQLVSKYIGETQKNLERVFTRFSGKQCILFFDEADSIFGKRVAVKDTKDKYANQEMSYLLQRIESYEGIIILASNVKDFENSVSKAFRRRLAPIVDFGFPNFDERYALWKHFVPDNYLPADMIHDYAMNYQLTGANIERAVASSLTYSIINDLQHIDLKILEDNIEKELLKERRSKERCTDENAQAQHRWGYDYASNEI